MSTEPETVESPVTEPVTTAPVARSQKGKKKKRYVAHGHIHILASYNNTVVTITDPTGNVIAWSSAGQSGFRGPKKATPYAAGVIIRNVIEKIRDTGMKSADVFIKGIGSGREAAVRALNANGIAVQAIKDVTPTPHNGCRPRKVRRV